jgi:hypothetical protein
MVQSGRSGFQNIAEGSVDSGVSKKSEIKLTGIAIGCLDELAKDYKKYLQRKKLAEWIKNLFYPQLSVKLVFLFAVLFS